ncbi:hypothetical protein PFICI_06995 [Pestalotiopsis fici W106-1]|uniref:Protein kinase domain-containing protein n=1 Tax=Pestalotiopsis fici (strain W106-1 / CGMCC3.15140) TaxID=1229662 RepID=W3X798_PESFW|nr:uncharacterized protein PFICI_06995 [Pestalotiopsis fici W106-1]ETS81993.1 hypothetical protein PFICI_06995 [Pestalotiopsis fici W106-1]
MELPPIPGPRLRPYKSPDGIVTPHIEFIQELGQGLHSIVWKVKMNGKAFALKLFKRMSVSDNMYRADMPGSGKMDYFGLDWDTITYQCLPFFSECRVYGRLKETRNEDLAVKCYGYLILDESYSESMRKAGIKERCLIDDDYFWQWPEEDAPPSPYPARALVKELMDPEVTFLPGDVARMKRDLVRLHRIGIVQGDIKQDAYLNARLTDFSRSRTVPHFLLDKALAYLSIKKIEAHTINDYFHFDEQLDCYDLGGGPRIDDRILLQTSRYNLRKAPSRAEMERRSIKFFADRYKWKPSPEDVVAFGLKKEKSTKWLRGKGNDKTEEVPCEAREELVSSSEI